MTTKKSDFPVDFKINHGIMATVPDPDNSEMLRVIHFVGFHDRPSDDDFKAIYTELKTDKEFGLTEIDFDLYEATEEVVTQFRLQAEADNYGQE